MSFRAGHWITGLGLFVLAGLIYLPGLSGGFALDDFGNLAGLSGIDGQSPADITAFVLQGFAGPSGRPLSLLSFAFQHAAWPDDPAAFKAVNLALHLFNGVLVLLLAAGLLRERMDDAAARRFALLAAAFWLLWPSQVSTVLYVIQRMSILAATCMLGGLLLYLAAWRRWDTQRPAQAHGLFLISALVGMPLGMLFKENAAIFPLLALSLHVLRRPGRPLPRSWPLILWIAALAPFLYLLFGLDLDGAYAARNFSLFERLLTEPRVLWMYLGQILLPNPGAFAFHYDAYAPSRSLLQPIQTLWALLALLIALYAALRWRQRGALAAFALYFFLAAHALEATIVPLELAFEHRSYLASFGPAIGLSGLIAFAVQRFPELRAAVLGAASIYLLLIGAVCLSLTRLWGDDLALASQRARLQPDSQRARVGYVEALNRAGHWRAAAELLTKAIERFPEDALLRLQRLELGCRSAELQPRSLDPAAAALRTTRAELGAVASLDRLAGLVEAGLCPAYSAGQILDLVTAARVNPRLQARWPDLDLIAGRMHGRRGEIDEARRLLNRAIAARPQASLIVQAASWELSQGQLDEARRHIAMLGDKGPLSWRGRLAVAADRQRLEAWLEELAAQGQDGRR